MSQQKSLLVTGSSRSGTTWVGRMLALDKKKAYVYEPFNVSHPHPLCPLKFQYWYRYLSADETHPIYRDALSHVFELRYPFLHNIHYKHGLSFLRKRIKSLRYIFHRMAGHSVLMKDPIALLSASWLARQFNLNVLVMIRHPAGFVGSIKNKGWNFDFSNFTAQPELLEGPLAPFAEQINRYAREEHDLVDKMSLFWKCMYSVVRQYERKHPDWIFLRLEDIASQPIIEFERLYDYFNLSFDETIRRRIHQHSHASSRQEDPLNNGINRKSASVINNWKSRLSIQEIERIREITGSVAEHFYADEEWL